jgi:5-methyltetrahydrofolate--homocysteine methyltransferase
MANFDALKEAVQKGKKDQAVELVKQALAAKTDPKEILDSGLIAAMRIIGDRFSRNEVFVPEMLIAARAMQAALNILEPILVAQGVEPKGTVVLGTVKGDLHDIGKNLVVMMLKGAGWQVHDLGVDVAAERFVAEAEKTNSQMILISSLLTTTMPYMKSVVELVKAKGKPFKVVIGGAPVTQAYADEIGAHGYGKDASDAVRVVETLAG